MLEKVKIKNFQLQKDLEFEVSPNITSIVGATDHGKSSTLGAIVWACTNTSTRDDFITWDETECRVELTVDGHVIERVKSKQENSYYLDGTKYSSFGTSVPEDIQKIVNLNEDCFQSQFDSFFWISLTGGEFSKRLNQIVNLGIVDATFASISKQQKEAQSTIKIYQERKKTKSKQLEKFDGLSKLKKKIDHCERLQTSIDENRSQIAKISRLIDSVTSTQRKAQHGAKALQIAKKAFIEYDEYKTNRETIIRIEKTIKKIQNCEEAISKVPNIKETVFAEIEKLVEEKSVNQKQIKKLENLIKSIEVCQQEAERLNVKLAKSEKLYKEAMKGKCPLCGRSGEHNHE